MHASPDTTPSLAPALTPDDIGHVGEHLQETLDARGITAYRLSKSIGVTQPAVSAILHGQRGITAQMALRLGRYFQTSPEYWLNLQMGYDLDRARVDVGEEVERIVPLPFPEGSEDVTAE